MKEASHARRDAKWKVRSFEMNESPNQDSARLSCVVRPPLPGDFEKMADLAVQLGYPCAANQIESRLAEMWGSNQHAVYVAEFPPGKIAGWIGVSIFRAIELETFVEISGLIVDESNRSRGVGTALLDAVEKWAQSLGCREISVHSNIKRERAHGFYLRNGYEFVKTQKFLRKTL